VPPVPVPGFGFGFAFGFDVRLEPPFDDPLELPLDVPFELPLDDPFDEPLLDPLDDPLLDPLDPLAASVPSAALAHRPNRTPISTNATTIAASIPLRRITADATAALAESAERGSEDAPLALNTLELVVALVGEVDL
jgi:hypothetical protein